jgi:hypothetical protein
VKAIALIQVSSYGAALEAANIATYRQNLELVEIVPFGTFCQLLIRGAEADLVSYRKVLRTADLQKSVIIDQPDERLLKAYYHLENKPIQNYLLILENEFAGYVLTWGQKLLVEKKLEIVDYRQPRFPGAMACLVMTGPNLQEIQSQIMEMETQKIKVSFVEEPSAKLRSYFDIEPKSLP